MRWPLRWLAGHLWCQGKVRPRDPDYSVRHTVAHNQIAKKLDGQIAEHRTLLVDHDLIRELPLLDETGLTEIEIEQTACALRVARGAGRWRRRSLPRPRRRRRRPADRGRAPSILPNIPAR